MRQRPHFAHKDQAARVSVARIGPACLDVPRCGRHVHRARCRPSALVTDHPVTLQARIRSYHAYVACHQRLSTALLRRSRNGGDVTGGDPLPHSPWQPKGRVSRLSTGIRFSSCLPDRRWSSPGSPPGPLSLAHLQQDSVSPLWASPSDSGWRRIDGWQVELFVFHKVFQEAKDLLASHL